MEPVTKPWMDETFKMEPVTLMDETFKDEEIVVKRRCSAHYCGGGEKSGVCPFMGASHFGKTYVCMLFFAKGGRDDGGPQPLLTEPIEKGWFIKRCKQCLDTPKTGEVNDNG